MASLLLDPTFKGEYMLPLSSFYKEVGASPEKDLYTKYRLVKATHYKRKDLIGRHPGSLHSALN